MRKRALQRRASPRDREIIDRLLAIERSIQAVGQQDPGTPARVWPTALLVAMLGAIYFALKPPLLAFVAVVIASSLAAVELDRWAERQVRERDEWRTRVGDQSADEALRHREEEVRRRFDAPYERWRSRLLRRSP